MNHLENDDWPLLSAIHGGDQDLPRQIAKVLQQLIESSQQNGCGDVPWPCFDYEAASSKNIYFTQSATKTDFYPEAWTTTTTTFDPSKLWTWALRPELLITWVCLAIFLAIVGCCWICTQLSDWLCKIAVILCLTTVLVSAVLAFVAAA